jgi:hypothetical protein
MAINFGDILGGLGAAYGGRAQEYAQGIQQREQGLTEQKRAELEARQRAMYEDANTAFGFLSNPELNYEQRADNIIRLAEDRLDALSNYPDADPSDTLQVLDLANQMREGTDPTAVTRLAQILTPAYQIYKQRYAPQQAAPEEYTLRPDEIRLRGTQVIGRGVTPAEPPKKLDFLQRVMPDGNIQTIKVDQEGNFYDLANTPITIGANERLVEGSSLTGSGEDIGITNVEATRMRDAEVATRAFVETATDAMNLLIEQPDINTFVGGAAALVNNLETEAKAIANSLGVSFDNNLINPSSYSSQFDKLGIEQPRMRSMITSLAFQAAAAQGQSGRDISNADITRFINEIGANSSDPRAFAQTLNDVTNRTTRRFGIEYETRMRKPYEGTFNPLPLFETAPPPPPPPTDNVPLRVGRFQIEVNNG